MTNAIDVVRARTTPFAIASAVLYAAFGLLFLFDLVSGEAPRLGYAPTAGLAAISAAASVLCLVVGDAAGVWPALIVVAASAGGLVLDLMVLREPESAVGSLVHLPVLGLYLGIFLRPAAARTTQAAVLVVAAVAAFIGSEGSFDDVFDGRNVLKVLLFTWLCLEAGIFARKRFKQETHVDPLTGALNRKGLVERAFSERTRATRVDQPLCVAVIDLDLFKQVNDRWGHRAGDRVLLELTRQWRGLLREDDIIVRLGGDEFLMLLPNTDAETGRAVLSRLNDVAVHPWSWGLVEWQRDELLSLAVSRADAEMYRDKALRRSAAGS